ncbi:MAG: GIY-YIG nuclease family protein [Putridiphycobacter sp.]
MYFVYVIRSLSSGVYYVGMAQNVELRLKEHNRGKSKFTKGHLPWELIYQEGPFETSFARKKEKYYKSSSGKTYLRQNGLID